METGGSSSFCPKQSAIYRSTTVSINSRNPNRATTGIESGNAPRPIDRRTGIEAGQSDRIEPAAQKNTSRGELTILLESEARNGFVQRPPHPPRATKLWRRGRTSSLRYRVSAKGKGKGPGHLAEHGPGLQRGNERGRRCQWVGVYGAWSREELEGLARERVCLLVGVVEARWQVAFSWVSGHQTEPNPNPFGLARFRI